MLRGTPVTAKGTFHDTHSYLVSGACSFLPVGVQLGGAYQHSVDLLLCLMLRMFFATLRLLLNRNSTCCSRSKCRKRTGPGLPTRQHLLQYQEDLPATRSPNGNANMCLSLGSSFASIIGPSKLGMHAGESKTEFIFSGNTWQFFPHRVCG